MKLFNFLADVFASERAYWASRLRGPPRPCLVRDFLDDEIGRFSRHDVYRLRDLVRSVGIFGATGSGKTRGSGLYLARQIVNFKGGSSGLILAAKPHEDLTLWREIFASAGRSDDLIVVEPGGRWRFNFLDYVVQCGGDTPQITHLLTTIGETLASGEQRGGEASFWHGLQEQYLYNAVGIVKLATGHVTAPALQRFMTTAATSREELLSSEWKKGFHHQCIHAACANAKTTREKHDLELHVDYWLGRIPGMADRTRSSIEIGVSRWIHVFCTGVVREIVSSETNVTPDDMLIRGKWILVNMPPAQWGDSGKFICAGFKYLTQWRVLQRQVRPGDIINIIWSDEFQNFFNTPDSDYLAVCRSRLGCMILLTQGLHSLYAVMPGDSGRHRADALLSNLYLKVFHALGGDRDTASWASEQLGRELHTFIGGSAPSDDSLYDVIMGQSKISANFSQSYSEILQPNVFQNGLRTGGPANGYVVDGIAVKSEPFANGQNYLRTSFSQR